MNARVELLALNPSEWLAVGTDPAAFAESRGLQLGEHADILRRVGEGTAAFLARVRGGSRWGSFLAVDGGSRLVVGTCAYKGPPDPDGAVEIAYFTFPSYEGRGYASGMAASLTARAGALPPARIVRAHTLPERNASVRILEKLGFAHLGEVVDPEDGPVWRWERAPASPSA
ncbi:MAG: GNAT family N-acetyltransferase [Gemmatimonadales bacterium]